MIVPVCNPAEPENRPLRLGARFALVCDTMARITPAPTDRLLTVRQAAELLSFKPRTLYKMAAEGRLPVVKIGRSSRFRLSAIEALIRGGNSE